LTAVQAVAKQIAESASKGCVVVIKSTVPVGTADMVREIVAGTEVVDVVSNPEFLREGVAIEDFEAPDRIVVGYQHPFAKAQIEKLYASFIEANHPVYFMDNRSAEITKYAANSLLATKISFANELARLCDAAGADIDSVRLGTGSDSRIGAKFLYAGVGYGGSCFPKDVKALIHMANKVGVTMQIATAVEAVNAEQKTILIPRILHDLGADLTGRRFAMWGLAFKPETDDIREAPALYMIEELTRRGAEIVAYDPEAMENVRQEIGGTIQYASSKEAALEGADALILMTEWQQFRSPSWSDIATALKGRYVYDGRNIYTATNVEQAGLVYHGIGRGYRS
jgi:UDPglucose 6-dehydrogenase